MNRPNAYLGVYATVVTVAFGALLLMGAKAGRDASFDTLTVHRINVVEPDGTLRMVVSDRSEFPGLILKGKETAHPRPRAGMLFYNDEGTEQGGLIFSGQKTTDGYSSGLSLTFDRFEQDQQMQLIGLDEDGHAFAGMRVNDVPATSMQESLKQQKVIEAMPEGAAKQAAEQQFEQRFGITQRYFAGKSPAGNSVVLLRDAAGHPRLGMEVTPDGKASIQFIAADGKIERTITANDAAKP